MRGQNNLPADTRRGDLRTRGPGGGRQGPGDKDRETGSFAQPCVITAVMMSSLTHVDGGVALRNETNKI